MASGTKRMSDDDDAGLANTSKIQRVAHAAAAAANASPHRLHHAASNHDFSGSVKRKLADSKRTGQACDRCKVSAAERPIYDCRCACCHGCRCGYYGCTAHDGALRARAENGLLCCRSRNASSQAEAQARRDGRHAPLCSQQPAASTTIAMAMATAMATTMAAAMHQHPHH